MTVKITPAFEFTYDDAVVVIYHANVGEGLPKHEHMYSHATFCASGSCIVRLDNKEHIITKNSTPLNLPELKWHEIEALENETVFVNVFSKNKA